MNGSFWNMGGYALFVWSSFAATAAVLGWNVLAPRLRRRELMRALKEAEENTADD